MGSWINFDERMHFCNPHSIKLENNSITPGILLVSFSCNPTAPRQSLFWIFPPWITNVFTLELCKMGSYRIHFKYIYLLVILFVYFILFIWMCVWIFLLSKMCLRFIQIVVIVRSVLLLSDMPWYGDSTASLPILTDGYFQFITFHKTVMNILVRLRVDVRFQLTQINTWK